MRKTIVKQLRKLASKLDYVGEYPDEKYVNEHKWFYKQIKKEYMKDKRILDHPHLMDMEIENEKGERC